MIYEDINLFVYTYIVKHPLVITCYSDLLNDQTHSELTIQNIAERHPQFLIYLTCF